jgi:diguanylate cyclase (GGDEF)-like protein/PAS domain S-box-containing protein
MQEQAPPVGYVVGIGSSAGGLEALEALVGSLRESGRTAYVVAQHLAPEHPSMLADLLGRCTRLAVITAEDGAELAPDTVVVAPPGRDISVDGPVVHVSEPGARTGPNPSIDVLMESVAQTWGEHGVGVILSGTGTDGSYGLRAVKAADGITIAQEPASAKFEAMPQAAITLGAADLVLEPTEIGRFLTRLGTPEADWPLQVEQVAVPDALSAILNELRRATSIDFSQFKESTLRRQVARRMVLRHVAAMDDYLPLLVADPAEPMALMNGLLVTVTSFFRDPEAFEALRSELAQYVADRDTSEPLRVWVPGCATGEEAYTVAMIASEVLGRPADLASRLKVFATDLDEAALAIARRGVYPDTAVSRIPAGPRAHYLVPTPQGSEVVPELRGVVVFARHNVGQDPPFPRLDVISCRNTLIYFTAPLQVRVLGLFAYALRPAGILLLGSAETPPVDARGFADADPLHRLFRRTDEAVANEPSYASLPVPAPRVIPPVRAMGPIPFVPGSDHREALLRALLSVQSDPCLLLNERHEVVEIVGDVGPYCQLAPGQPTMAVSALLRPELLSEARALLVIVRAEDRAAAGTPIRLSSGDATVRLIARPVPVGGRPMVALEFAGEPGSSEEPVVVGERGAEFDAELDRLERELMSSQATLQGSLEDLETAHEELLSYNEELQASAEELQSSYEELETSNEELQASNEELSAANVRLREQAVELERMRNEAWESLANFARVTDALQEVVWQRDASMERLLFVSQRVREFTGSSAEDLGEHAAALDAFIVPEDREAVAAARRDQSGRWEVDYRIEDHRGSRRWVTERGSFVADSRSGNRYVGTLTDISREHSQSEQLVLQATVDAPTGLLNRYEFRRLLDTELSRSRRSGQALAVAWIDLDLFKEVNDHYGHAAGDAVLAATADRLRDSVRDSDIIGRLGGDEFAVILADYDNPFELESIIERIRVELQAPVPVGSAEVAITGSIGIALFPLDGDNADVLLQAADAAMYAVKGRGGDGLEYFDAEMRASAEARRRKRDDIAAAIVGREFELHYQPIVSTVDGSLWGVEALLRWIRDGEAVAADDFIEFCEETGQIRALTAISMSILQGDLRRLRSANESLGRACLNLSVSQLEDRSFQDVLDQIPSPTGLTGLVVEVTESLFLPDNARALDSVGRLATLGAEVSVDDYGSGYSNFALMERLAPEYIKLDKSFLAYETTPERKEALVAAAIEMAHALGAKVIVEGVETAEQYALVTGRGADLVQGWHIAPAMTLDALLEWQRSR